MKDEEKILIENLFDRLKKTELSSDEKDYSADELIQKLVKKQPTSSYYMAQTILVQETHIKKMHIQIEELKKKLAALNIEESNKKPSFLSSFFKKNPVLDNMTPDNNTWKNKDNIASVPNSNATISTPVTYTTPTRNSGFLGNALQTATGVAGGMILGNMLMNVFNHSKTETDAFDTINNHSSSKNHTDDHTLNNANHQNYDNLVSYEEKDLDIHKNESDLNVTNNITDDVCNVDYSDDNDINDDNFI